MTDQQATDWEDPWEPDDHRLWDGVEDVPLYPDGKLAAMTPTELHKEWERQCNRHDAAVDRCEAINSPTIEDAAARMKMVEAEQKRRGLEPGPSEEFFA